jgi:hypothetical protein
MENTIRLYRTLFGNRAYVRSVCTGAVFLAASTIAIFAAVTYATVHASNHVTDFVLSRVGPFNVRFLFIYGTFTAFAITASLLAWRPNRLPFALKAMALFLLVRAVFVALTHHGTVADRSAEARTVLQLDFLRKRLILFWPHRSAVPRGACLLAHPAIADVLSRTDRVLRFDRAARPLSLFDRCARRLVHHPRRLSDVVLAIRPRLRAVSFLREPGCATAKAGNSQAVRKMGRSPQPKQADIGSGRRTWAYA